MVVIVLHMHHSIAIDIDLLQQLFLRDRLTSIDSLPQDPSLAPSAGVKRCTYHRWFATHGRPGKCSLPILLGVSNGKCKIAPDSQILHRVSSPPS